MSSGTLPLRLPGQPVVVALDFDKTLTIQDTIAQVAVVAKNKHPENPEFEPISDAYFRDYAEHEAQWNPRIARHAKNGTVTLDLLHAYLESLRPVEQTSLARVSRGKLMAGALRQDFGAAGKLISLQPGAATAINRFLALHLATYVVSVNWSEDFIRGALFANGVVDAENIEIHCNNPEFDRSTGLSTGRLDPQMTVASDKTRVIDQIKRFAWEDSGGVWPYVVYAGDSLTDLPALLAADLGFVVGSSSSVAEWCQWLGILPQKDPSSSSLRFTSCWADIEKTVVQSVISKDQEK
ncbi:hypothetical protein LPJ64_005092 [Coemansia asiatica]|uniref:HAD-like protein n=1 Tax=Coemansia asiatica TaxID=1052880 RepID=A0A9W8CIH1_9FUNG|nr:hypothetical protein LPJ64_005092 [Coemansia asiatica]